MKQVSLFDLDNRNRCPICNKYFDTRRAMRIHHSHIHDISLAGVKITCEYCGKVKEITTYEYNRSDHHFCSRRCYQKWFKDHAPNGQDHHQYNRVTVKCAQCGKKKKVKPCEVTHNEHHFCDHACYWEWLSEHTSGENSPSYVGAKITITCEYCGQEKEKYRSHLKGKHTFCSRPCAIAWHRENGTYKGDNNPAWRGGYDPYYGENWYEQRDKALERDHYSCQVCEKTRAENYDEFERDLEVHHIIPLRVFTYPEQANSLSNLVTLCKSCHQTIEHINIWRLLVVLMLIKLRRNK